MIDLVTVLGFLVVLAAIGDATVASPVKAGLAAKILDRQNRTITELPISRIADRWLGRSLISWRSVSRSAIFSIASIFLSLFAAGFPNFELIPTLLTAIAVNSPNGMIILFISAIGCMCADFASIVQTRIFARAIERFQNKTISAILCIADVAMSLTFFVFVFSFFRVICYVIAANYMFVNGAFETTTSMYPSPVAKAMDAFPKARKSLLEYTPATNSRGSATLLQAIYLAGKLGTGAKPIEVARRMREVELDGLNLSAIGSTYKVTEECFDGYTSDTDLTPKAYGAYSSSYNALYAGLREIPERIDTRPILDKFEKEFSTVPLESQDSKCKRAGFIVQKKFDSSALLKDLSPGEAYLGALTLTLRDTYTSISTKFASYYTVDLSDELSEFLRNAWMAKSQTFLGASGENPNAIKIANYVAQSQSRSSEYAIIPITTYIVSSLSVSLILLFSIVFAAFIDFVNYAQSIISSTFDRAAFEKSVFTSLALLLSAIIALSVLISWLLQMIWQFVV